jgi:hypothetical protein
MARPGLWSDADNAKLVQLEAQSMPREEIAQRLRKTRQQVTAQIGRLRNRQKSQAGAATAGTIGRRADLSMPWSAEEVERVLVLGATARGMREWSEIAAAHFPGRSAAACKQQYFHSRGARHDSASRVRSPALAESPREPQSITAVVLGDPPPGRSALDRQQQFSPTRGIA